VRIARCLLLVGFCAGFGPALVVTGAPQSTAVSTSPQTLSRPADPGVDENGPIASKVLDNGLQIIVVEDHAVPIVTIDLAVRNGSFTEPPELNGLSHLYEHMFFSPNLESIKRPNVQEPGMIFNGTTLEEVVEYFFTTTTPDFPAAARVLRDAAREPAFDEQYFAREREVVIGEMDRHDSDPYSSLQTEMNNRLFFKYPSRKEPIGNRETVGHATTAMMRLIRDRYYVPNNSAIIVAGDVTPDAAYAVVDGLFGDWPRRPVDPFVEFPLVEHPPLPKSEGATIVEPVQNVIIDVGWQGPSVGRDDAATYAADVFSFVLRQPNSRFQRALVDSGLATGISLGYYTQSNVGPITVLLQTTPANAKAAIQAVYTEMAHFNDPDYYSDEELESGKALLEADILFSREKTSDYVHNIAFWWSSTGLAYFRGYLPHVRTTTRADISRFVKTYLDGKPHVGLAVLSDGSLKASGLTPADLIGGAQ
jgi:zinc protease